MCAVGSELARAESSAEIEARRGWLFRGVVRSMVRDVEAILNEVRFGRDLSPAQTAQRLDLARHYVDYLVRLCDGRV